MNRIRWDRRLNVAADGKGLVGHVGVVLLRRLADRVGLTGELAAALPVSAARGWLDRSTVLVQLAVAISLGATNLSDAERLSWHHRPLGLSGGSDSTMRRLLAGLDAKAHRHLARCRARVRSRIWTLLASAEQGFPWVEMAGKTLTGWVVIDMGHDHHLRDTERRRGRDVQGHLGPPPARGLVRQHYGVPGHGLAARERRSERRGRPHQGVHRRPRAAPGRSAAQDPGPDRRGRGQPSWSGVSEDSAKRTRFSVSAGSSS